MGVCYFRVQDNRMQAQAQISGQVSGQTGQVGGQLPGLAQQNGSSLASQTPNHGGIRRSWHTDTDLFSVWHYRKDEEYVDLNTLEWRLQFMVKRFQPPNSRNQNLSHHNPPPVGTVIPTQGLQQIGNVSSMIPTPGAISMGNMLPNRNGFSSKMHGNSLMGTDSSRNKMVPTLGLTGNIFSNNGDIISSLAGQLNNTFHSQQGVTYS